MSISRREFVSGAVAVGIAASPAGALAGVHQDKPTLKIGLIGCGGRGSGAIRDNLSADKGAVVWAMGDLFEDRPNGASDALAKDVGKQYQVGDRKFTGFDAYKKVIASGVDVVILATPPGFRPPMLRQAVEAGKHVFMEKPVAVDAPGIRSVIESGEMAKKKGLTIVSGTQRRHDLAYLDCIKRIKDGAIGDVVALNCYWNQGGLWSVAKTDKMTDTEWMIRNWLYFTWLSGDHIVEQHIHNLDVCNWVMGSHPISAMSLAGRQVRTDPIYGNIFDHFATEYEYANGVKLVSMCRQIDGCDSRVAEHVVGSKGTSNANTQIKGPNKWRWEGDRPNPYVLEHVRLYKSIRSSEGYNEARQVAESTFTAIMGRMAAYSGQVVEWDSAIASTETITPAKIEFGPMAVAPVAMPGQSPKK